MKKLMAELDVSRATLAQFLETAMSGASIMELVIGKLTKTEEENMILKSEAKIQKEEISSSKSEKLSIDILQESTHNNFSFALLHLYHNCTNLFLLINISSHLLIFLNSFKQSS